MLYALIVLSLADKGIDEEFWERFIRYDLRDFIKPQQKLSKNGMKPIASVKPSPKPKPTPTHTPPPGMLRNEDEEEEEIQVVSEVKLPWENAIRRRPIKRIPVVCRSKPGCAMPKQRFVEESNKVIGVSLGPIPASLFLNEEESNKVIGIVSRPKPASAVKPMFLNEDDNAATSTATKLRFLNEEENDDDNGVVSMPKRGSAIAKPLFLNEDEEYFRRPVKVVHKPRHANLRISPLDLPKSYNQLRFL